MNQAKIIKQSFQVNFDFNLIFTSQLFAIDNTILSDLLLGNASLSKGKAIVVIDQGVIDAHPLLEESILHYFKHHNSSIELRGSVLKIPGGEQSKNNEDYIKSILEQINEFGVDRHSYVIAIGGGAVLDAVGFAAAIAHRGVRLIRIPTTILSQNDSGIGRAFAECSGSPPVRATRKAVSS